MDTISNNPLAKHFRQPALYITLTSNGKFWEDGSLNLPAMGEIPVYPMTAKDEIVLRTPDALLNGTSVVQVIQSCCPNILDAWAMPSVDVDSTLIAIRIASFGNMMPVTAKCPHCNEEHEYDVNLQQVLSKIQMPDYSETYTTDDNLIIKFKPLNYRQVSDASSSTFSENKLVQALADPNISDEVRKAEYTKHLNAMIDISLNNIVNITESITTSSGEVITNTGFIKEYYQNCSSVVSHHVQSKMQKFSEVVSIKDEEAECSECGKGFKLNIEFDYSHFFANGF